MHAPLPSITSQNSITVKLRPSVNLPSQTAKPSTNDHVHDQASTAPTVMSGIKRPEIEAEF